MIQIGKPMPDFAREPKAFHPGSGQPVFKLRNEARGKGQAVNNAARRQEESGNQYPEANAKWRFHNRTSTRRRRFGAPHRSAELYSAVSQSCTLPAVGN